MFSQKIENLSPSLRKYNIPGKISLVKNECRKVKQGMFAKRYTYIEKFTKSVYFLCIYLKKRILLYTLSMIFKI